MAQTQRTYAQIIALLPDNNAGDISPQDIRDFAESFRPLMGEVYRQSGAGTVTTTVAGTYYEVATGTWASVTSLMGFDMSAGNGRLTYTGTVPVMMHIALSISFTLATNNVTTHWRIGVNGTPSPVAQADRKVGTGADVGSTALHLIAMLNTGDYISAFVSTETAGAVVTPTSMNLQAIGNVL